MWWQSSGETSATNLERTPTGWGGVILSHKLRNSLKLPTMVHSMLQPATRLIASICLCG